jgi:transcriptional regulator with XRE-family HTH domain
MAQEVTLSNDLDPRLTPVQRFGRELARVRKAAGLSQVALSKHLGCSASLVAHIEIGDRTPKPDLAARCDAHFDTGDRFTQLQKDFTSPVAGPGWFIRWADEIEPKARVLRSWDPLLIPGLLQTEDYARALFAGGLVTTEQEIEDLVRARMQRKKILERDRPPILWALLDETVLQRRIGDPAVMCGQLDHIMSVASRPTVTVQLVPQDTRCTVGLTSGFIIAELPDAPTVVSVESSGRGEALVDHEFVSQTWDRYDKLRAEAYRPDESLGRIKEARDRWNHEA